MATVTDLMVNKLLEIINQLQSQIVTHSQDALVLMMQTICIDGIGNIIAGMICIFFIFLIGKIFISLHKKIEIDENKLFRFLSLVTILVLIIISITNLSYWNWIKIFNPKIYLAHEIMDKVL